MNFTSKLRRCTTYDGFLFPEIYHLANLARIKSSSFHYCNRLSLVFLLSETFFHSCPLAAHRRCTRRVCIARNRARPPWRRKRASFNATLHLDLYRTASSDPPPRRPRSTFSVTPTICLRSRGVKRIILWICIGLLSYIYMGIIHNGPLPLPTSDASALISSLLSPFRPGVPPRVLSGLSTLFDRNTVTAGLM